MFNIRPDGRWYGFHVELPEGDPDFRLDAGGWMRGVLPSGSSTAFLDYDIGADAMVPKSTMFNIRPEWDFPGLHKF